MATNIIINDKFKFDKDYQSFNIVTSLKNEYGYAEKYIYEKLLSSDFERFNKIFGLSSDEVIKLIKKHLNKDILLSDIFEYKVSTQKKEFYNCLLIADNIGFKRIIKKIGYQVIESTTSLNCFLCISEYCHLAMTIIFKEYFQKKYHLLYDNKEDSVLYKKKPKFNEEQKKELIKLSKKTLLSKIPYILNDFSIQEIYACLADKNKINENVYESNIKIYSDCKYVFIHLYNVNLYNNTLDKELSYERVLYVPIEFFKTKDWTIVENVMYYSYPIEDKNAKDGINFISDRQKNLSFFKKDIMLKVKELLMKC